ncbi:RHS domain-containing protein [Massilia sp. DJPM01]|uniref:RHS repeat domain-containing protein n=1 Tax=Massilia sp. DJPM01 TaxID=3024404 RepID=UPI00259E4DAF|nr:RHS repeat domain-containing protein [Massilia sp. DJPM01]MDM5181981.1 RHS domain-containing protein [Massilia sp. DJPM01]
MSSPDSPKHLFDFQRALKDLGRAYDSAGEQVRHDIDQRLQRWSHRVADSVDSLGRAAMRVEAVRSTVAVGLAIEGAEHRFHELLKTQLEGLDFSQIWGVLWTVVKEVVLYVGGGAALGGTVGGVAGAFVGGAGAVPGAIGGAALGAQIGGEILVWMGLGSLVLYIGETIPTMCGKMAEGFATAWHAGALPDSARGQYAAELRQASESFAQGKLLLVKAILAAIVLYLSRGQASKSLLMKELGNSKLGPAFADWVAANQAKLMRHPALQPRIAAAEGEAASAAKAGAGKAKPPAEPVKPAEPAKPANEAPNAEGKARRPCPACLLVAQPVNPLSGSKILAGELDLDFALPAALGLVWQRNYSSAQGQAGWLGAGWSTPISDALQVGGGQVVLLDGWQREVTFSLPRPGESIYSPSEKITLSRSGDSSFELIDEEGLRRQFATAATASGIARLVGLLDANGNRLGIGYNGRQLPERIEDSAGRVFMLEFSEHRGAPRLSAIILLPEAGEQGEVLASYAYDADGNLAEVRNRLDQVTRSFAYRKHLMVEHAQPGGLVSRYEYEHEGAQARVVRNWTNNGLSWDFRYLARETVVTDKLGREQRYRFDANGEFIGHVDAAGGVTERRLDQNGRLLAILDPGGRSIGYRYDERGRVVRVERDGKGTGIVYDARVDKPALITNALGASTALRYDERGNLLSVTNALGQRTSYQYDEHGLPVRVIDPAGGIKRLAYNRAAQLTAYTDCSGNTTRLSYDANGKLARTTDAQGNVTVYSCDALGRLEMVTQADGSTERYEYDALGRLVARIDAAGHRTSYVLDSDGKPLKRIDARGGVLEYRYDAVRRMAALINENGDAHHFVYDALDRLAEESGVDARLTRYRYDASGLLVAKEEHGSGARTEYTRIDTSYLRDRTGQLVDQIISRTTGEAQAEQLRLRFAYDDAGRMTRAINADAEVAMRYDALGQLVAEQTDSGGESSLLRHAYDELGNRIETVLPDGRVLNQLFYGSGHLHQINIDGEVITDIERDRLHRPLSRTQGALTSQFRYDPMGRMLSQVAAPGGVGEGAAPLIARKYDYDASGNLLAIDDRRNGRTTYSYDVLGRILSALQPQSDERFAFDPAHNLLDDSIAGVGRIEGNRVRVFEDKRFEYDAHGNLSEKLVGRHTRMRFEWNAAHQLVKAVVTRNAGDAVPTVQTVKYVYDPFGRRIAKRDSFGVTRFAWDGNRLLCERRASHTRTYLYEAASFVPLAQYDSVDAHEPQAPSLRGRLHYLHTDHLGTPRELTDADGSLAWAGSYRAWGNVLTVDIPAPAAAALEQVQPIRFQGQYFEAETGLHYNRFRYYDPDIGRFVSQDPIGLAGGFNTYQYAPNPVTWVDPAGLSGTPIVVIGEGQGAVDEAARLLKQQGYAAESMMFPRNQWRGGRLTPGMAASDFEKTVQWNKEWLAEKIRQGYKVVDIGPDGRATPSRFYLAEQEALAEAMASKTTLKKFGNGETVAEMRARVCRC